MKFHCVMLLLLLLLLSSLLLLSLSLLQWDDLVAAFANVDDVNRPTTEPVVLTRASSTNGVNPFRPSHCYHCQRVIFEVRLAFRIKAMKGYQWKIQRTKEKHDKHASYIPDLQPYGDARVNIIQETCFLPVELLPKPLGPSGILPRPGVAWKDILVI